MQDLLLGNVSLPSISNKHRLFPASSNVRFFMYRLFTATQTAISELNTVFPGEEDAQLKLRLTAGSPFHKPSSLTRKNKQTTNKQTKNSSRRNVYNTTSQGQTVLHIFPSQFSNWGSHSHPAAPLETSVSAT